MGTHSSVDQRSKDTTATMRTVAVLASALATTAVAQSPEALVKMYTHQAAAGDNPLEAKFAQALEARVSAYAAKGMEIPQHITDTVLATLAGGSTDRASAFCPQPNGCTATISLKDIWSYGCWCMLQDPTNGAGNPLDKYDEACRNMAHCNRCAEADSNDPTCKAAETGFQVAVEWDADNFGLNMDCSSLNTGSLCAEHLCACEINFLAAILDLLWDGEARTESFQRTADFDYTICFVDQNAGTTLQPTTEDPATTTAAETTTVAPVTTLPEDTTEPPPYLCCGIYPNRVVLGATASCCESGTGGVAGLSTTFNALTQKCCADGSVANLGDC